MKTYKVWIDVEEHDTEGGEDEYADVDLAMGSCGEYATVEEAVTVAKRIHQLALTVPGVKDAVAALTK